MWSRIEPCLRAASDDLARFCGGSGAGVDERCVASPGPTSTGPRELTSIVDHSRGGSSHGPLEWTWSQAGLAPCMRTGWPSVANSFAPVSFAPVSRSRRWIPSRDSKNASVRPSRQMRRISVSTSPTFTGQVREVFHQATPTQGRHLAAHLIQRLPACPIPEIARLGANPTQVEGRTRRLLRHRRSKQRLHGSHQRTLSSWADAPPEATATPPATNSECSSSQEV